MESEALMLLGNSVSKQVNGMKVEEIFERVYKVNGKLATLNLVRGTGCTTRSWSRRAGTSNRLWNPYRSKLAAAIINNMKQMHIAKNSSVLYLGAASGTTPSHVSDIVGKRRDSVLRGDIREEREGPDEGVRGRENMLPCCRTPGTRRPTPAMSGPATYSTRT